MSAPIDKADLAGRLRAARAAMGLTQGQVADSLSLARTTLVAIERGERQVRPAELVALAELFGTSANQLLRPTAIHSDKPVQFRRNATRGDEDAARRAASTLNRLASSCVELERRLERPLMQRYPSERQVLPQLSIAAQGEELAVELRSILGLGNAPARELAAVVESELGVRVFRQQLASDISEVCLFDGELGANVLLNSSHSLTRQRWSLAHALGHLLTSRQIEDVCYTVDGTKSPSERIADAFAAAFLMPASAMRRRIRDIVGLRGQVTVRDLILLAGDFAVSAEAMCRRLEDLELVGVGTWHAMKGRKFEADAGGQRPSSGQVDVIGTSRLAVLVADALTASLITEGQAAEMLCVSRIHLRRIVDDINEVGNEPLVSA